MTLTEFFGRLIAMTRRKRLGQELAEDLEAHIELFARDLIARGETPERAFLTARRQLGNVTRLREDSRDAWGFPSIEAIAQDLRYAFRGLRRNPGFTVTVVMTLALGIGANTAIFGVIDRLMFRPYPYMSEPGTINRVYLESIYRGQPSVNTVFPWRRYLDLERAQSIGTLAAQSESRFAVGRGEETRIRHVMGITSSLVGFFDAPPARGRWFTRTEESDPSIPAVAVLSHSMWTNDFGQEEVLGSLLKIGVTDYTIIGVAPPGLVAAAAGPPPDVFIPIATVPSNVDRWLSNSVNTNYGWEWVQIFVKRNPGVSEEAASIALSDAYRWSRASERSLNAYVTPDSIARPRAIAGPVKQAAGPGGGAQSSIMLWAVGVALIVLIIACANVANLMLARLAVRQREVSIRLAIGVRRRRLVLQFLVEGLVLAALGAIAGLVIAQWGGSLIRLLLLGDSTSFSLANDWRTLGVALICALATTLLTTVGPALSATRADVTTSLKADPRAGGGHRSGAQAALVVVQSALSVLLLVGAGLFVRSFVNARSVALGYDSTPVLDVFPDFRGVQMDSAVVLAERERLLEVARAIPGVESAALVDNPLFATRVFDLRVNGIDSVAALGRFSARIASPEYFDVMQIRIVRGRRFSESDRSGAPLVALVSESMARSLWPGQNPIGQCMRIGGGTLPPAERAPCTEVIGVAENTAQRNITDDPRFMYYMPAAQRWPQNMSRMYLRMASRDLLGARELVRRELSRAMPSDGFVVVRPLQEQVDNQSRSWRLGAVLFASFGALAFVVAVVGLYGVVSYSLAQRRRELAVRVALGARTGDVLRLVLKEGAGLTLIGIAIGVLVALAASSRVQPLLFSISAMDPITYGVAGVSMLLAALAACLFPAVKARKTDPNEALRPE